MIRKFLFILLLLFPFSVKAYDIENFDYDGNKIYDFSNLYTSNEEREIIKEIDKFIKVSNIDLVLITVDNINSYDNFYNNFKENKKFGRGFYRDGIVIIYNKTRNSIKLMYTGEGILDNLSFVKFRKKHYHKYEEYIGNENIILTIIEEWSNYYIINDIYIILFLLGLALILNFVLLKFIKNKYDILKVENAHDYYKDSEISFFNKE